MLPNTRIAKVPWSRTTSDWLLIFGFCAFFYFWGLNQFGLIGADEPRYAQVAREMLARHNWITPSLGGEPWLEKPPLYYWQTMMAYRAFGVSDWVARIPSGVDASLMIVAVYLFLRRFHPGFELDGALMTSSTAAVIGFARAASTDMPLAATFTIAMLAWFAWYESESRVYLAVFYAFIALASLAKGPIAPFLAAAIIIIFAVSSANRKIARRSLWIAGMVLFCAIALPWYIAVQWQNPEFIRTFLFEHNLARFTSNLFHHREPFWYYAVVGLLGLVPWTIFVIEATFDAVRLAAARDLGHGEGRFRLFLVIWLLFPMVFFSFSQSKLPGYILPALPAGTLLLAQYVRCDVLKKVRPKVFATVLHSIIAALPLIPALALPYLLVRHQLVWSPLTAMAVFIAVPVAAAISATLVSDLGLTMLRFVTLVPVVLSVAAILRIGAPTMDDTLTARPLAKEIAGLEAGYLQAAVFHVPRETEYGLTFYRDQKILSYDRGQIPSQAHLLVIPEGELPKLNNVLRPRRVSLLGVFPPQHLEYYWVSAVGAASP